MQTSDRPGYIGTWEAIESSETAYVAAGGISEIEPQIKGGGELVYGRQRPWV